MQMLEINTNLFLDISTVNIDYELNPVKSLNKYTVYQSV